MHSRLPPFGAVILVTSLPLSFPPLLVSGGGNKGYEGIIMRTKIDSMEFMSTPVKRLKVHHYKKVNWEIVFGYGLFGAVLAIEIIKLYFHA